MSEVQIATITDAEWAEIAKESGLAPAEVKRRYLDALGRDDLVGADAPGEPVVSLGEMVTLARCKEQPFEASIWKMIGIKGSMKLCGPEDNWSMTLKLIFVLAGVDVASRTYTLSKKKAEMHDTIELFVFRASYTIGMTTDKWCVVIGGTVGYWKGKWFDHGFKKKLFCFGDII